MVLWFQVLKITVVHFLFILPVTESAYGGMEAGLEPAKRGGICCHLLRWAASEKEWADGKGEELGFEPYDQKQQL